jgi:hypothetical protein
MANSITTKGMAGGPITTTHKTGESVSDWVDRHNTAVDQGMPGNSLTTEWPCATGTDSVTTNRLTGESDSDFILRHEASYMLAMIDCPPVP